MPSARRRWLRPSLFVLSLWAVPVAAAEPATALDLCRRGQEALERGQDAEAQACFRESVRLDPDLAEAHLGLATAHLGRGEDRQAGDSLAAYLRLRPGHVAVRFQFAELLLRLGRVEEGRAELERIVAAAQEDAALGREHLVACHSRLVDIAGDAEDGYGEHLNRGIALLLLARRLAREGGATGRLTPEGLLCQAAGELALARQERPDEARPCWYLAEVFAELGQRQPAERWLRAASAAAPFTSLTPWERRGLLLACRRPCGEHLR
jgi:tetratricopeptide (TPR) repeat protein